MARPLVIQTEHLDPQAAAWLGERCELTRCASDDASFGGLLARAAGLVIRTYTTVDGALLARATRLRVVGRAGVGLDNVDIAACRAKGVQVVSTPDANTRAVVEYVIALLLDATRPRLFIDKALPPARWKALREELRARRQLCELTLGVYGMGRIGTSLARAAAALNMRVLYHDLLEIPADRRFGAESAPRERLLAESDVVSVHVDGRSSNRGLIDGAALARMKPDVLLVNTSRGFVVDVGALTAFMKAHPQAQAILDVHEPEPIDAAYPLLGVPNVRLAPHIASATDLAQRNMSWVVRDVWRVLNGEAPEFPAEPEPA